MEPSSQARNTPGVRDITVRRSESVEVVWEDGLAATFSLGQLRRSCPCAACRNARDQGRPPWNGDDATLRVTDAELVGAWGFRPTWQDGHGTGIFPWDRLRAWAQSGRLVLPADSGLGGQGGNSGGNSET
jgi:DUF971 family protein